MTTKRVITTKQTLTFEFSVEEKKTCGGVVAMNASGRLGSKAFNFPCQNGANKSFLLSDAVMLSSYVLGGRKQLRAFEQQIMQCLVH